LSAVSSLDVPWLLTLPSSVNFGLLILFIENLLLLSSNREFYVRISFVFIFVSTNYLALLSPAGLKVLVAYYCRFVACCAPYLSCNLEDLWLLWPSVVEISLWLMIWSGFRDGCLYPWIILLGLPANSNLFRYFTLSLGSDIYYAWEDSSKLT
jgi:hypothetical protein